MGSIRMPYLVKKKSGYYWQLPKKYADQGFKPKSKALGSNESKALAEHKKIYEAFQAWRKGDETCKDKDSVAWLIGDFKSTGERYLQAAERTRNGYYGTYLKIIDNLIGDLPVEAITRQHAKQIYAAFREKPRKAQSLIAVARVLFGHAYDTGRVDANPFSALNIKSPKPRGQVWNKKQIETIQGKACEMGYPSMALATQLAVDIGQRPGDLRSLTWGDYDGDYISLRQEKSGREDKEGRIVKVPILPELKALLDNTNRQAPHILICEDTDRPYTQQKLSRRFREICNECDGLDDLQFRDFRRTAVLRLAEAGCNVTEIASITGHSFKSVHRILETYLPRTTKQAENAILKLQRVGK